MHPIDIWNQFDISRQKVGLVLLLVFWGYTATAQRTPNNAINLQNYEKAHTLRYGFQLGTYNSLVTLNTRLADTSITHIGAKHSPGFLLGFILNVNFKDELWSLRFLPNISFYERQIEYQYSNGDNDLQVIDMAMIEVPMVFKYKSLRRKNHRVYMMGGLSFNLQAGGTKGDPRTLNLLRQNVEATYGFGFDIYNHYFKFSPELRFSHGLNNILASANNEFNANLNSVYTHRVALIFNFE